MKIHMQLIDNKGFIHFLSADNKKKAVESLKTLREGTEIRWISRCDVIVSQQYIKS